MIGSELLESLKKDIEEVLEKYCPNLPQKKFLTFELMLTMVKVMEECLPSTSKPQGET